MGKISVFVNKDYKDRYGWYAGEMIKDAFLENDFAVVSDSQPIYANVAREIVLTKTGLPFDIMISTNANAVDRAALYVMAGSTKITFVMSVALRGDSNATYALAAIHIAYSTNFMIFGLKSYNQSPLTALPSYDQGYFIPSVINDLGYPYLYCRQLNTFYGNSNTFHIDGLGQYYGINITTNLAYLTASVCTPFVHPEGKIILAPLFISYTGVGQGSVDATIPNGYVSINSFPSDCPNEFKLDGEDYVRNDRTVFKI